MQTRAILLLTVMTSTGALAAEPGTRPEKAAATEAVAARPALDLDRSESLSPAQKRPKRVRYTIPPPKKM
jgi:hypothetical protein